MSQSQSLEGHAEDGGAESPHTCEGGPPALEPADLPDSKRARADSSAPVDVDWPAVCAGRPTGPEYLPRPSIRPGVRVVETEPPKRMEDTILFRAQVEAEEDLRAGRPARLFDLGINVEAAGGRLVFVLFARADINYEASVAVLTELLRHGVCLLSPQEGQMTISFVGAAEVFDGTEGVSHPGQVTLP